MEKLKNKNKINFCIHYINCIYSLLCINKLEIYPNGTITIFAVERIVTFGKLSNEANLSYLTTFYDTVSKFEDEHHFIFHFLVYVEKNINLNRYSFGNYFKSG